MSWKTLFWLSVLATVCLGCSGCQMFQRTYFGGQQSTIELPSRTHLSVNR